MVMDNSELCDLFARYVNLVENQEAEVLKVKWNDELDTARFNLTFDIIRCVITLAGANGKSPFDMFCSLLSIQPASCGNEWFENIALLEDCDALAYDVLSTSQDIMHQVNRYLLDAGYKSLSYKM